VARIHLASKLPLVKRGRCVEWEAVADPTAADVLGLGFADMQRTVERSAPSRMPRWRPVMEVLQGENVTHLVLKWTVLANSR
jgi:hypothetical protein